MTVETVADVAVDELEAPAPHHPGYCSDHPNVKLVTHRAAGERAYYSEDPVTICLQCPTGDRERCGWCGGRLYPPGIPTWQVSQRRTYCKPLDRLHAFRARARAERIPKRRGRPPKVAP